MRYGDGHPHDILRLVTQVSQSRNLALCSGHWHVAGQRTGHVTLISPRKSASAAGESEVTGFPLDHRSLSNPCLARKVAHRPRGTLFGLHFKPIESLCRSVLPFSAVGSSL